MMYTFDVETSYRDGVAWVWSWGLCDENLRTDHGNGVDWLRPLLELPDGSEVWVHNLPFDGEFVFWSLIEKGGSSHIPRIETESTAGSRRELMQTAWFL